MLALMSAIDQLLKTARRYAEHQDLGLSTVSWRMFADNKKLQALIDGADIQTRRLEQAMGWLSANWPDGLAWPSDVERPGPSSEAAA